MKKLFLAFGLSFLLLFSHAQGTEIKGNFSDIVTKGPWVDVRAYASFAAAITAIGSDTKTLLIPNEQAVSSSLTVPTNVTLAFLGGKLNIGAGYTVTLNGMVVPTMSQIVMGSGTLALSASSRQRIVYPEWWGIDGTNDHVEIQKAIDCAETGVSGTTAATVHLSAKTYNLGNTEMVNNVDGVTIEGEGFNTLLARNGGSHWTLTVAPSDLDNDRIFHTTVRNLMFYQHTTAPTGGGHLRVRNGQKFTIDNIYFIDGKTNLNIEGCWYGFVTRIFVFYTGLWGGYTADTYGISITLGDYDGNGTPAAVFFDKIQMECDQNQYGSVGMMITSGDGIWVNDMHTRRFFSAGLFVSPSGTNHVSSLKFDNCFFDGTGKTDNTGTPVLLAGTSSVAYIDINFYNCTVYGAYNQLGIGGNGISVTATGLKNLSIVNTQIYDCYYNGVYVSTSVNGLVMNGNMIYDNNQSDGGYSAVRIADGGNLAITGNILGRDGDSPGQEVGLYITGTTDGIVSGNFARGTTTPAIISADSGYYARVIGNAFLQTLTTSANAMNHDVVYLNDTGGGKTVTLPDGTGTGNTVTIWNINSADWTLSITNHLTSSPEVGTMSNGDYIILVWSGTYWFTLYNYGVAF